jgi:hypothetical protein
VSRKGKESQKPKELKKMASVGKRTDASYRLVVAVVKGVIILDHLLVLIKTLAVVYHF